MEQETRLKGERRRRLGADKLAQAIVQAFELDEWWRTLQVRLAHFLTPSLNSGRGRLVLPDYWRRQRSSLRADLRGMTGQRAGMLTRRIASWHDRFVLLERALQRYAQDTHVSMSRLWIVPPSMHEIHDPDTLLPLIAKIDAMRPNVSALMTRYELVLPSVLHRDEERRLCVCHERPLRAHARMLTEWIDVARGFERLDVSRLENALTRYEEITGQLDTLRGRLQGVADAFLAVMDARDRLRLETLLRLWSDRRLPGIQRWSDQALAFLGNLNLTSLEERRAALHAMRERRDALRDTLADILNAPLTHFVLHGVETRITALRLWDEMPTGEELLAQTEAFARVARELPGEAHVRKKARRLMTEPLHDCVGDRWHIRLEATTHRGRSRLGARKNGTLYLVWSGAAACARDGLPVCCKEHRVVSLSPHVVEVNIDHHLPLSLEVETTTLLDRLARARMLVHAS